MPMSLDSTCQCCKCGRTITLGQSSVAGLVRRGAMVDGQFSCGDDRETCVDKRPPQELPTPLSPEVLEILLSAPIVSADFFNQRAWRKA